MMYTWWTCAVLHYNLRAEVKKCSLHLEQSADAFIIEPAHTLCLFKVDSAYSVSILLHMLSS